MKTKNLRSASTLAILASAATGCMDSDIAIQFSRLPDQGGVTATAQAVRSVRPGLAVRGMACLSCHANVQASVISDFGHGDAWYLDRDLKDGSGNPFTVQQLFGAGYYNPYTFQTLDQVTGRLVVPKATVPADIVAGAGIGNGGATSLDSFLMGAASASQAAYWRGYFGQNSTPATLSFLDAVSPGADAYGAALAKVTPLEYVYVGAPTVDQIVAISPAPGAAAAWIQTVDTLSNTARDGVGGLSLVRGLNGGMYATNSGTIDCSGKDVVIRGTLLLDHAQLSAGYGCRIHVTGPVFIEGPIDYVDNNPLHNLQITSASAILMGVGIDGDVRNAGSHMGVLDGNLYSHKPLQNRLLDDSRNARFRAAPTGAAYGTWANGVLAEAANIGTAKLVDASVTAGAAATGTAAGGQVRTAVNYEHLLINAPIVHSRYLGKFQGVIVAEIALFSLGEFHFAYDDSFADESVSILPALKKDILCASGSSDGCQPIVPPAGTNIGS